MATVRQDEIQLRVDFITDESRRLAKTIQDTKGYNQVLSASQKELEKYRKEVEKAGQDEVKRAAALVKVAEAEKKVALAAADVVKAGKEMQKIDLSRVAPAQLTERAKQLAAAMKLIPASAPQFKVLEDELGRVNTRLRELNTTSKGLQNNAGGGGGILGSLGSVGALASRALPIIGAVVAGIRSVGAALSASSKQEQLNIAFETFLGNADKAKAVIADLKDFEVKTPFEAEQVNAAGRALLAFGVTSKDLIPTLTRIGDVASGTGKDFNELVLIYGKAKTQGIIQGEELNQLAEAGIPIYAELAKVLGVNENQIRKLGEQGRIQFSDLEKVFQNLTSEGGKFGGLMERQSKSLGGLYSTLKSALSNLLTEVGNVLAPLAKGALELLISAVQALGVVAKPVFEVLKFGFESIVSAGRSTANFFTDTLPASITTFVRSADQIPYVGKALSILLVPIRLIIDAFESMEATATGVMASLTDIFTNGGKNAGKAYNDARNKALAEERQQAARDRAEDVRDERQLSEQERAEQAKIDKKAAAERADRQKKAQEERKKTFDAFLKTELAAIEAQATQRDLISESFRLRDIISEDRYQEAVSASQERKYKEQLELYRRYGQERTTAALEAQNNLLAIEQGKGIRATAPLAPLPTLQPGAVTSTEQRPGIDTAGQTESTALAGARNESDQLQQLLQDRFLAALITEQDYELQRLELKRQFIEEELAILRASSQPQYEEIRKREEEKNKISFELGQKRLENQQRLQDLEQQTLNEGAKAVGDLFHTVADLLGEDEKRKAKHAGIVKALEIANIQVNLVSEVSGIFANAQKSAVAKLLGPVAGNILAVIQATAATLRAGVSVGKIQAQKFERGNLIEFAKHGFFGGRPHSAGGTKGYFDDGTSIEVERDEAFAVINKKNAPMLRLLSRINSAGGHGVPFFQKGGLPRFAEGGLPQLNTTPSAAAFSAVAVTSDSAAAERMERAALMMLSAAERFPRTVEAVVSYLALESTAAEIGQVRDDAAL